LIGLPRSEGRGPIEALEDGQVKELDLAVSHGQKAVDPLKLCPVRHGATAFVRVSHGQKAVDPLKPDRGRVRGRGRDESPTVRRPWTH